MTALSCAAKWNQNEQVIRVLVSAGADVNVRDERGRTPLHLAAGLNPNPEIIRALATAGAEVNAEFEGIGTALVFAAASSVEPEVVRALLDAGASVAIAERSGSSLLGILQRNKNLADSIAMRDIRRQLNFHGALEALENTIRAPHFVDDFIRNAPLQSNMDDLGTGRLYRLGAEGEISIVVAGPYNSAHEILFTFLPPVDVTEIRRVCRGRVFVDEKADGSGVSIKISAR